MEQKRIKVRLTKNSPYSDYGYYDKGDIGYIDGYVNDNAVIILENGKFAKADLRWIEVVNEENKNVNTELKESEDEKIRKALKQYFVNSFQNNGVAAICGVHVKDILAWLERQAEHKKFRDSIQIGDKVTRNKDGVLVNLSQLNRVAKKDEKQGEQKPANKVEPKFHEGKWVTNGIDCTFQIVFIENDIYYDTNNCGSDIESTDKSYHLWTIQDAKDGDVLATENFIFIFKNIDNGNGVHYYCHYEINKHEDDNQFGVALPQSLMGRVGNSISHYSPATKEQRDTLMKAMADAGYTFDFEKKELKKIEQSPDKVEPNFKAGDKIISTISNIPYYITKVCDEYYLTDVGCIIMFNAQDNFELSKQKPAWSKEDEDYLKVAIENCYECGNNYIARWLESLKDRVQPQPKQEWSEEDEMRFNNIFTLLEELPLSQNWLKSLKDRVQPQPKQEWSEEDERRFNNLCFFINQSDENVPTKEGFINWLKSFCHHKHNHTSWWYECIKECVGFKVGNVYNSDGEWIYGDNKKCAYDERFFHPQSHWKPSDEQIECLSKHIEYERRWTSSHALNVLSELLEQLKKLK